MGTYKIMMITSQARRAQPRRAAPQDELRQLTHQPLPMLAQVVVGALVSLSLAATYTAKAIFNAGGSFSPLAIALALTALVTAGLVAGGGWRAPGSAGERCAARNPLGGRQSSEGGG